MQFVPFANTCSVEMIFEAQGQRCENVYHVKGTTPMTEVPMTTIAEAFKDWFTAHGAEMTTPNNSLVLIVCKDLDSQNGPAIEYNDGLPIAGTGTGSADMPLNVTAAVSFGTSSRGRSYRGRIYHIGLLDSQINGNILQSGPRASMIADYAALIAAVHSAGYDMVVASKWHNKALRTTGVATVITSVNVDQNLDSQRRRLNGRGQ